MTEPVAQARVSSVCLTSNHMTSRGRSVSYQRFLERLERLEQSYRLERITHETLACAFGLCCPAHFRCGQDAVLTQLSGRRSRSTGRPFTRCDSTISSTSPSVTNPYHTPSG